jgi:UDP:flavonoid glycosyltransferase YjiC (YdhE family)
VLLASSPHFSQPWLDDRPQVRMTGFWFDDSPAPNWTPCAALARFLGAGLPPLVLTLSSLPVVDPTRVVTLHAEAAAMLGARLIIQQGWAGLSRRELPESAAIRETDLHFTGDVPHSWLFPRCRAVIQHGGIGTTAQALRCGRPMLIEPYCNDQHFNGERIAALGVGAAVDHRLLTPENLADALARYVLTGEARSAAGDLGRAIDAEHGLTRACDLIEAELAA